MSNKDAATATGFGTDNAGDDFFGFDITLPDAISKDLGTGDDTVDIGADTTISQVRLTFTSAEVGNGLATDANTLLNQDGSLAVRVQAENGADGLIGPVSRFDDEGITFQSNGTFTFDVRDLVSGVQRGNMFDTVILGTMGDDVIVERFSDEAYYINGGMGNDRLVGGNRSDFLVGGAGNDTLTDRHGNDSVIGGGGNDQISGGLGADFAIFNVATDGSDSIALGRGDDTVNVVAPLAAQQIRLTFTSSEIGNANALDSNTLAGQDGGLAVRLQAEDGAGNLTGLVSRTDDEGMTFVSATVGVTFDVRDLVSGAARGDLFEVVHLGTEGSNRINESAESKAYYINAGMGDDRVQGGLGRDFLVGGLGNDRLKGNAGADSLLGGAGIDTFVFSGAPGNDTIFDFVSGTDKIDLTAFGIGFADLMFTASGANTTIDVDADSDSDSDFQITLLNAAAPAQADFLF